MKIVITRVDGGVSIMTLVQQRPQEVVDETGETSWVLPVIDPGEEVEKWKGTHPGQYVSHREMPDEAIPVDRSQRHLWCDETPDPVIDIRKA